MPVGLTVSIEEQGSSKIVRLEGRVDATSTPILEKRVNALLAKEGQHLLFDFSKVDYVSSAGMRLLLSATKRVKEHKGRCVLSGMQEDVLEVIRMAGFERILSIYSSETEALKALERQP